jgi:hypothetical protein
MAVLPKALTAFALEVERGRVEKNQAQLTEQVIAQCEQPLLYQVLGCAWANAAAALVSQFIAQPAHRAVQLVQLEIGDPIDHQTMPPFLGGAIGAGVEQPMQDRQKYRALEIELETALAGKLADHPPAAGFAPQSLNRQRRTELASGQFGCLAFLISGEHNRTV